MSMLIACDSPGAANPASAANASPARESVRVRVRVMTWALHGKCDGVSDFAPARAQAVRQELRTRSGGGTKHDGRRANSTHRSRADGTRDGPQSSPGARFRRGRGAARVEPNPRRYLVIRLSRSA